MLRCRSVFLEVPRRALRCEFLVRSGLPVPGRLAPAQAWGSPSSSSPGVTLTPPPLRGLGKGWERWTGRVSAKAALEAGQPPTERLCPWGGQERQLPEPVWGQSGAPRGLSVPCCLSPLPPRPGSGGTQCPVQRPFRSQWPVALPRSNLEGTQGAIRHAQAGGGGRHSPETPVPRREGTL